MSSLGKSVYQEQDHIANYGITDSCFLDRGVCEEHSKILVNARATSSHDNKLNYASAIPF